MVPCRRGRAAFEEIDAGGGWTREPWSDRSSDHLGGICKNANSDTQIESIKKTEAPLRNAPCAVNAYIAPTRLSIKL